jgi:pyridoxamine 5'-phosphate oxidase
MNPLMQFRAWYARAKKAKVAELDAVAVATADRRGRPSVRHVYIKIVDERGFVFCTNRTSLKARELATNPRASLVYFWQELGLQIRVTGAVEEIARAEAVATWRAREKGHQLGTLASRQSTPLKDRKELARRFEILQREFANREVPCPPTWVGFRVKPTEVEFWERSPNRLHAREVYTRTRAGWKRTLLNP